MRRDGRDGPTNSLRPLRAPQVGISSVWYEGNPCNMHLNDLAAEVKAGVQEAGMVAYRFNTIGVSDGISMGTDGMSYSLQSRDLIADSIETVMRAQWYDANVSLPGCDKNMPGTMIAAARLNRPALMVYGGTIKPGHSSRGEPLDIVSAFQSFGGYAAGLLSEPDRADVVRHSCPGAGACGGMYTANTMASAIEAMGMTLPHSSSTPAEDPLKRLECRLAGAAVLELLRRDIKPRDIMTRAAFENAMVLVMALGGSTNAVLHLIAMAAACGIELTLDDFQRVSDRTPFLADLKPSGKYVMEDLHKVQRQKREGDSWIKGVGPKGHGALSIWSIKAYTCLAHCSYPQPTRRPTHRPPTLRALGRASGAAERDRSPRRRGGRVLVEKRAALRPSGP